MRLSPSEIIAAPRYGLYILLMSPYDPNLIAVSTMNKVFKPTRLAIIFLGYSMPT